MSYYSPSIEKLIESFEKLPSIGSKTAVRLAFYILNASKEETDEFINSIQNAKKNLKFCSKCFNISDTDPCEICKDPKRDQSKICVVEDVKDVVAIEKIHEYKGLYHVLDGLISPLDGINPEDIKINELLDRITKENIEEVIIAVKPSIEGETTAMYISKLLETQNVKVSRIAHGIPLGVDMEYIDSLTLEMALEQRKSVN